MRFCKTSLGSSLVLLELFAVASFDTAYRIPPLLQLTVIFCLIACRASLFGLLTSKTARQFGELAYSIYLLHGIVLFVAIHFAVGVSTVAAMSPVEYWILIAALVPVLLGATVVSFRLIETPGLGLASWIIAHKRRPKLAS